MKRMIALDGAQGEGGGQILRSALSLSMITGQPFTITSIRAGRAKPGLLRQHLTAVKAAAEISRATRLQSPIPSRRRVAKRRLLLSWQKICLTSPSVSLRVNAKC